MFPHVPPDLLYVGMVTDGGQVSSKGYLLRYQDCVSRMSFFIRCVWVCVCVCACVFVRMPVWVSMSICCQLPHLALTPVYRRSLETSAVQTPSQAQLHAGEPSLCPAQSRAPLRLHEARPLLRSSLFHLLIVPYIVLICSAGSPPPACSFFSAPPFSW